MFLLKLALLKKPIFHLENTQHFSDCIFPFFHTPKNIPIGTPVDFPLGCKGHDRRDGKISWTPHIQKVNPENVSKRDTQ